MSLIGILGRGFGSPLKFGLPHDDASVLTRVADCVTSLLNAFDFGLTFTAVRSYPDFDEQLDELDALKVDVVPVSHEKVEDQTRDSLTYLCTVDIGIRQRPVTSDDIDRLILLEEQITQMLDGEKRLVSGDLDATLDSIKVRASYSREFLRQHGQFFSLMRATYYASVDT